MNKASQLKKYRVASEGTYTSRFAPQHQLFVLENLFKDRKETFFISGAVPKFLQYLKSK